jgi:hypothetical protein
VIATGAPWHPAVLTNAVTVPPGRCGPWTAFDFAVKVTEVEAFGPSVMGVMKVKV